MARPLVLMVLFVLVVATIIWVLPDPSAQPKPAPSQFAPLIPEGEAPAAADEAFRDECLKSLPANWTFGATAFSQSKEWGLVLRADYTTPDIIGPAVNRVVCSRNADGKMRVNVTMGQNIPPLQTGP
jgi:hypothetical protein